LLSIAAAIGDTVDRMTTDGDRDTVHLRCGSDLREGLALAGFAGEYVQVADPVCQGPVLPVELDALIRTRAGFIASAYEIDPEVALRRLTGEYAALRGLAGRERVVLWFEHDSYDQLILALVLRELAARRPATIELICIDAHPGVERFIGLGQLTPDELLELWPQRVAVDDALLELGARVFDALAQPDPMALHQLALGTPTLPAMGAALGRHLRELPWTRDGLSLTERQTLTAIGDDECSGGGLFRANHIADPLPFLGDTMYAAVLRDLASGPAPALTVDDASAPWPQRRYRATDVGRDVLAGDTDWIAVARPDRWIGGVHVCDGHAPWRWDDSSQCPIDAD
jgi:hypothetical protein